jgi:hypothetical protein
MLEELSYKELQERAKKLNINSVGKSKVILEKEIKKQDLKPSEEESFRELSERRKKYKESHRSFDGLDLKLKAPQRDGYTRRWVNDITGRLDKFENEYFYTKVLKEGIPIKAYVGSDKKGNEQYAYLMETPREWYNENQAEKRNRIIATEENAINLGGRDAQGNALDTSKARGTITIGDKTKKYA